jgi:hypothetical protein
MRINLALLIDKIIRSLDMNLKKITLFGKSAGGGVAIHLASMNSHIKKLFIACPATVQRGKPLANRNDLHIKISWNGIKMIIKYHIRCIKNFWMILINKKINIHFIVIIKVDMNLIVILLKNKYKV